MPRDVSPWVDLSSPEAVAAAAARGQITEGAALLYMEQIIRDRRAARVRAHGNSQVAPLIHQAVDQALGLGGQGDGSEDDEFSGQFPPWAPLGHQVQDTAPRVYQAARRAPWRPVPLTDDQLLTEIFGDTYFDHEQDGQGWPSPADQ